MKKGESVKCIVDYDLFGVNIKGKEGCYIKEDKNTGKCLIWFECNGEWAELKNTQFERMHEKGHVSKKNKEFVKKVKKLKYASST